MPPSAFRPELVTAAQGAVLKLRAAGVDVDPLDNGVAVAAPAGLPGLRGSEDVLGILLSAILAGRTVVAIAHRLHTAHDADRVAVVDGGRIVEIGSHDELVAAGGDYAALWHSWQHE